MTLLERLYSDLLIAQKALGGDSINHEEVYKARDAVDSALFTARSLLNEKAKTSGDAARRKLRGAADDCTDDHVSSES